MFRVHYRKNLLVRVSKGRNHAGCPSRRFHSPKGKKAQFLRKGWGRPWSAVSSVGTSSATSRGPESPSFTHLLLLQLVAGAPHHILLAGPWENDQHRAQSGLEGGLEVGDGSECGGKYGRGEEGGGACCSELVEVAPYFSHL
jgi:hypothetical protein